MSEDKQYGNVVCTNCGAGAHSKCPSCRNVFMEQQSASVFQSCVSVTRGSYREKQFVKDDGNDLVVTNYYHEDQSVEDQLVHLAEWILSLHKTGELKIALCKHHFVHRPGTNTCDYCGQKNIM